eukprot:194912-Rhodomonas_salina.3
MAGQLALAHTTLAASGILDCFVNAFLKKDQLTTEQNAIACILSTKYMMEVLNGKHFKPVWHGAKFYKHPAVIALAQLNLKFHYESVTEAAQVNLTAKLIAALSTQTAVCLNKVAQCLDQAIDNNTTVYSIQRKRWHSLKSQVDKPFESKERKKRRKLRKEKGV